MGEALYLVHMNITLPPKCPACSLAPGHPGVHVELKRKAMTIDDLPHPERLPALLRITPEIVAQIKTATGLEPKRLTQDRVFYYGTPLYVAYGLHKSQVQQFPSVSELLLKPGSQLPA